MAVLSRFPTDDHLLMIRRRNGKFQVVTSDGSRVLGTHDTKDEALKQLRAVEASKHDRKKY